MTEEKNESENSTFVEYLSDITLFRVEKRLHMGIVAASRYLFSPNRQNIYIAASDMQLAILFCSVRTQKHSYAVWMENIRLLLLLLFLRLFAIVAVICMRNGCQRQHLIRKTSARKRKI